MKHRQEGTPTQFELCCGVYQPQISPMRRGKAKKLQEAQLCKKAGGGSSPSSGTPCSRITGSNGTEVRRAHWLWLLKRYWHNRNLAQTGLYGRPT